MHWGQLDIRPLSILLSRFQTQVCVTRPRGHFSFCFNIGNYQTARTPNYVLNITYPTQMGGMCKPIKEKIWAFSGKYEYPFQSPIFLPGSNLIVWEWHWDHLLYRFPSTCLITEHFDEKWISVMSTCTCFEICRQLSYICLEATHTHVLFW